MFGRQVARGGICTVLAKLTFITPPQRGLQIARKAFQPPTPRRQRPKFDLLLHKSVELCHGDFLGALDVGKHRLAGCWIG